MDVKEEKDAGEQPAEDPSSSVSTPTGRKRKSRLSDVSDIEPRQSAKRQRVPVSRFQSPLEEIEPRFKVEKEEKKKDDNLLLYKKGAFLAVRGAEGIFYLCRAAQNINNRSKRLRIQWLTLDSPPNVYKFDYVDTTEMETILTEISMEKISKDSYKLPTSEQKRAEKILDRAIRVEQGIATADEVEEEAMEEAEDEADSSDEAEEEEEEEEEKDDVSSKKKSKGTKKSSSKDKEKFSKQKEKSKGRKQKGKSEKKKGPDRNLKPNPKIKILEKDPFFETKERVPDVSALMTSKLVFRAVNTGDSDALKELLERTEGVTNFEITLAPYDDRTAMHFAGQQGKHEIIRLLTEEIFDKGAEKKRKEPPAPIISPTSTGIYNPVYLGIRAIRNLNVSRGNKEGNEAFLKESNYGSISASLAETWMEYGVSVETMETFILALSVAEKTTVDEQLANVIPYISAAVTRGHRHLAAKYVAEAERLGGYGFNFLHKEVLSFDKEDLRDIILAASVRKKPFSNDDITPLHCAAINPNVKYLTRLLSIEPDVNIQTRTRARPIHFAAACEGTAPLEFLLKRNASPYEVDSQGNLPIHFASRSDRSKNIDVLVKHAKSNAQEDTINEKWGVGMLNRPNRFSYCPLHMAVEGGHLDAVRTLIKHNADVNKQLSAGKDKITPLMIAAQRGNLNIARLLIQSGAAVEILDKLKRSALTHAIINGSTNVASYLLYLGADPNRVDSSNNSLVHYAAAYGWYFCLKLLIKDAGARPDEPNDWQTTPINIAFLKGNHGLVEMLFNHKGVDINFTNDSGMSLASIACSSQLVPGLDTQISSLIKSYKADPTVLDLNGYNALHHLAANNIKIKGKHWDPEVDPEAMKISVKIAEVLISAGCDPTICTNEGKTPVMLAIEQVNVELVRFLVDKGGTVSPDKNNDEKTVLHLMAEQCCITNLTPMLRLLAEHKPLNVSQIEKSPDGPKENGKVSALDHEKERETSMQLDSGDKKVSGDSKDTKGPVTNNINGEDEKGDSKGEESSKGGSSKKEAAGRPTIMAASQQDVLNKMAQDRDFVGFTPLLRACYIYKTFVVIKKVDVVKLQHAREFIKALIDLTGSDVNDVVGPKNIPDEPEPQYSPEGKFSALHFMVNAECEKQENEIGAGMNLLLSYKPNPNLKDLQDKTPLVLAIESARETIVKSLLEGGADPNIIIKGVHFQVTPLVLAAERGSIEIMQLLLHHRANVKGFRSDNLHTAVHVMVTNRAREDETIAVIQSLLQAGADINAVDSKGNTPLHLAVYNNKGHSDTSTSLEEFLLDRGANVFAKNKEQNMPLHLALQKKGVDPIELCSLLTTVMRDQRVDESDAKGFTPLLYAASSGATICCMHLLQRRANIEAKEHRGNTPLGMAIFGGFDSCAIMLMQRSASLSCSIVISLPRKEEVKELEEEKKKKKRPTLIWHPKKQWQSTHLKELPGESITIFEGAVKNNLTGVAHMLLDALGMPMEAVESALNLSKFYLALRLLRRIPDVSRLHAKNKDGQNLFHVLALKTSRYDPDLQIKVAGALLEKRVPLADKDRHGFTPLMYAALMHQSVALAKFLIVNDLKFDPKVKDNRNRSIMAAFMWKYNWVSDKFKVEEVKEWLDLLIDTGCVSLDTLYDHPLPHPLLLGASFSCEQPDYFETRCTDATSPLIFAIRNYDFGLAKYMLQKGANPNFSDSNGLTPMIHAVRMNDVNMVKLLLNYTYDPESDEVAKQPTDLKPQLSKQQSRQVMTINFEVPKDKNPDDELDEELADVIKEDDAVSLSKHTEENENSVDLDENNDDEEPEVDDRADNDHEKEEDSDHDTDIVEDGADDKVVPAVPEVLAVCGATKLSLTRHVSQMTKEREFAKIEKSSPVDLSLMDKNGWTAVHHAVCSLLHATFDNAEIVYLLGQAGAPLEAKTKTGETPMDLAKKTDAENVVKILNKLLVQAPYNKEAQLFVRNPQPFVVAEVIPDKIKPDFKADAEEMLSKLDAAADGKTDSEMKAKVDANCEIKSTGEVACHLTTNIPYDVTLSKVDVTCGQWGMYNFYKLQIVRHTAKNLFILFTRWGRIGDRGQYQHTPYQTLTEAAKEFCKIYKSKTGNDWNQTTKFQNHPKKYRLMPKPENQHKQHKVEFNLESPLPTKQPEPVFDLISEVSSVTMLLASVQKVGLNEDFMPFGRMKRETLLDARRILTDISELIEKVTKLRNNLTADVQAEYQSSCEEIAKLTNEYYHLVPIYGFEYETIQPISEKKTLREHTKLLADLLDLQIANTILLGADLRKSELNPIDYIYNCLDCRIQPLLEEDPETQFILTNIHASVPTANINRVFKVSREGEAARLAALNMPNHQLLWHGSSMSNFISILSRGLLVTPPEVPWTGHLFGEGIYFADTFLKSSHYCHNHSTKSTCKVMLLCEVALGNPKIDVKHGDEDHLDDDINSLKILGQNAPVTDFDARLPFGATLSLGQVQNMSYQPPARIAHNEYIVHNAEQVAIRYLVLYNG